MSRSPVRNQLFLNDGRGNKLAITTGTWVTNAVNIDEHRRLSITIAASGGFTGILQLQGTDELAQCAGQTGTQEAGNGSRPGTNGFSGAQAWSAVPSATWNWNANMQVFQAQLTDVGSAFVRLAFNTIATGLSPTQIATGTLGGTGTFNVFLTAKNT